MSKEILPMTVKWLDNHKKGGKSLMAILLERFIIMYPSFQSFFITQERKEVWMQVWAEDLTKHGIKPEDVRRGLEECTKKDSQFMPSLPQFIHWCKPPVIPVMHRDFPKIEQKGTPTGRKEGLEKLHIAKEQLTNKG